MAGPIISIGTPGTSQFRVDYGPIVQDRALALQGMRDIFGGIKSFEEGRRDRQTLDQLAQPNLDPLAALSLARGIYDPEKRRAATKTLKLVMDRQKAKTPKWGNLRSPDGKETWGGQEGSQDWLSRLNSGWTLTGDTAAPKPPPKPSAFEEKLRAMGYTPGTPDYQEAARKLAMRPDTVIDFGQKGLTGEQQRTIRAGVVGQKSLDILRSPGEDGKPLFEALAGGVDRAIDWVPGSEYVQSDDYLRANRAFSELLGDAIYLKSGAQAGTEEFEVQARNYRPEPGDGPKVIADKIKALQVYIDVARRSAGAALDLYKDTETAPAPAAATPSRPASKTAPGKGGLQGQVERVFDLIFDRKPAPDAGTASAGLPDLNVTETPPRSTGNPVLDSALARANGKRQPATTKAAPTGGRRPREAGTDPAFTRFMDGVGTVSGSDLDAEPATAAPPAERASATVDPALMTGVGTVSGDTPDYVRMSDADLAAINPATPQERDAVLAELNRRIAAAEVGAPSGAARSEANAAQIPDNPAELRALSNEDLTALGNEAEANPGQFGDRIVDLANEWERRKKAGLLGAGRFAAMTLDQLKAIPAEAIAKMTMAELDALEAAYTRLAGASG